MDGSISRLKANDELQVPCLSSLSLNASNRYIKHPVTISGETLGAIYWVIIDD